MSDEIIKVIRLRGEVIEGKTLQNLKEQFGQENVDTLIMTIATIGGSVKEGLQIMIWLDEISKTGVEVVTVVEANAYSIGSMIMQSADVRLISKHGEVMVHNPMLPELKYVNANELESHLVKLRELESAMYNIYQMFIGGDEQVIKELMDKETYLSPEEAVKFGFADMVIDMKPKPYDEPLEAENKVNNINMIKHINSLKKAIKMINGDDFVNLTYNTKGGSKIEIYQEDASSYKVGDKTDLKEGSVQLGDGSTLTVENFVIKDIKKEAEVQSPENSNVGSAPNGDENDAVNKASELVEGEDDIKNAEVSRISSWESSVQNESFNVGDVVTYTPTEFEPEPTHIGSGEWQLKDGRKFLTDSTGTIRMFLENVAPATESTPVQPEVQPTAEEHTNEVDEEKVVGAVEEVKPNDDAPKTDELKEANAKLEEMEAKFKALEEKLAKMEDATKESEEFMDKASQAISAIAKQTSSNFSKEAAKLSFEAPVEMVGSSIFKKALARSKRLKENK